MSLPILLPRLNSLSGSGTNVSQSPSDFDPSNNRNTEKKEWMNWAETSRCVPEYFHTPRNMDEIRSIILYASQRNERIRVVGYGHSPGEIALTQGHMVALGVYYDKIIAIDRQAMRVTCESGISLESLNTALDLEGLALPSLGSISDQTLGGALACGTHGTNAKGESIIATCVVELELMDSTGKEWRCNGAENTDLFNAARISLGALGIITKITLQCEIAYDLIETTTTIPFRHWTTPQIFHSLLADPHADFIRFHWIPHTESVIVTKMKKVYGAVGNRDSVLQELAASKSALISHVQNFQKRNDKFLGFHLLEALYYASTFPHMDKFLVPKIAWLYSKLLCPPMSSSTSSAAAVSSTSSSWRRQDRHDRILNFDCLFKQYVTEWAIDQRYTIPALIAVREYIQRSKFLVHFPIEVRFGGGNHGGDGIWLSPCYSSKQTWIGIIMYRPYGKDVEFQRYFEGFERLMNGFVPTTGAVAASSPSNASAPSSSAASSASPTPSFSGKPHWAKNVCMPLKEIPFAARFPKWHDWWELRKKMDPNGMFVNEFIHHLEDATRNSHVQTQQIKAKL